MDQYLRKNLSAEKLAKIDRIKTEAAIDERIRRRLARHISEHDEQIVQKYLNEGVISLSIRVFIHIISSFFLFTVKFFSSEMTERDIVMRYSSSREGN